MIDTYNTNSWIELSIWLIRTYRGLHRYGFISTFLNCKWDTYTKWYSCKISKPILKKLWVGVPIILLNYARFWVLRPVDAGFLAHFLPDAHRPLSKFHPKILVGLKQGSAINPRIPGITGIPGIGTGIWDSFSKSGIWDPFWGLRSHEILRENVK